MKKFLNIAIFLAIIAAVSVCGLFIGKSMMHSNYDAMTHDGAHQSHILVHEKIGISAEQRKSLVEIEKIFDRKKTYLEEQMKLANMELAQAIENGGYDSSEARAAVDKIHKAMGEMQILTLEHFSDMQSILDERQKVQLKEMVVEQLYRNARE